MMYNKNNTLKRYHLYTECDGEKDYIYFDTIRNTVKHIEYAESAIDAVEQYIERHFAGQTRQIAYDMIRAEQF